MSEITYSLSIEPEDIPVEGNALASGDEATDRACEQEIISRLESGDDWAWCTVIVRAEFGGFVGEACLGGCSYENEEDFKRPGGYWEDLCHEALTDLRAELRRAVSQGWKAEDLLASTLAV